MEYKCAQTNEQVIVSGLFVCGGKWQARSERGVQGEKNEWKGEPIRQSVNNLRIDVFRVQTFPYLCGSFSKLHVYNFRFTASSLPTDFVLT